MLKGPSPPGGLRQFKPWTHEKAAAVLFYSAVSNIQVMRTLLHHILAHLGVGGGSPIRIVALRIDNEKVSLRRCTQGAAGLSWCSFCTLMDAGIPISSCLAEG